MEHVTSLRHPVPDAPRPILYLHSSAGRYGADRQLAAIVGGLDPEQYRAIVVLAHDGPLVDDLGQAGAEVLVRPLSVLRRDLLSPAGLARVAAAWASDAGGLGHLARHRDVALVHTNSSVTLGALPRRGSPGSPTSGTCASSTAATSGGGRPTGGCC